MVEVQYPPYLPPRSRQGMMGTGRHVCDKRPRSGGRLAGDRHPGLLINQGPVCLPRHLSLPPCHYVTAVFSVPVDGRNTIVPDSGTARSVTVKPPWSLGDSHAVATRVQMFPASVSCT